MLGWVNTLMEKSITRSNMMKITTKDLKFVSTNILVSFFLFLSIFKVKKLYMNITSGRRPKYKKNEF